jgi:LacI family transcriptional regulator
VCRVRASAISTIESAWRVWFALSHAQFSVRGFDAVDQRRQHTARAAVNPSVLIVLHTEAAWSRGILKGFISAAREHEWSVLHYAPGADMAWLAAEWAPRVAVIGPEPSDTIARLAPATLISVTVDRSAEGIASVCLDETAIAAMALQHLRSTGLQHVSTFRFDEAPFALARERAFVAQARAQGATVVPGWGSEAASPSARHEDPRAMLEWLRQLPKPCGIFTCTDSWARTVARYAFAANLRVPEDIALVGADNDVLECELMSPPLSSVAIPWHEVGRNAAALAHRALAGAAIEGQRLCVGPQAVVARRSSDIFGASDPLVAQAVRWIRLNAQRRLTVSMVRRAVSAGHKLLERRFRAALNRTVYDEIRRAHVDVAKGLLQTTELPLIEVAHMSGFSTAALLNVAFRREVGMPPGLYRRRVQGGNSPV